MVLGEERIGGGGLEDGRFPERLQIKLEVSSGQLGERGEAVLAFGPVNEEIVVVADVDVGAGFQGMVADDLGEVVGDFVALVGIGKLEAISAEHETGIRILNGDGGRGGGGGGRSK